MFSEAPSDDGGVVVMDGSVVVDGGMFGFPCTGGPIGPRLV